MNVWSWILVVAGGALASASLWLLARAKRASAVPAAGLSPATKTTLGLAGLVLGYHLVAYGLPSGSMPLRVPPERLWIAGLLAGLALGASVALDGLERRSGAGASEPSSPRG